MQVLRSYEWNGHCYSVAEQDDGTRIEIKGDPKMTEEQAMAKVPPRSVAIMEQPIKGQISAFSDQEIVAEASRRKLVVKGLAV
jgi:hypothetical protein